MTPLSNQAQVVLAAKPTQLRGGKMRIWLAGGENRNYDESRLRILHGLSELFVKRIGLLAGLTAETSG